MRKQIELKFHTVFFHAWLRQYSSTAGFLGEYDDSFHLNENCNYILLYFAYDFYCKEVVNIVCIKMYLLQIKTKR